MDAKLVNDIFRNGIRTLMGGFNPWGFGTWLKSVKEMPFFKYMVPITEIPILEKFAENMEIVAHHFFQWDERRYQSPIDQCFDMRHRKGEIMAHAFEGIDITKEAMRESLLTFCIFTSFKHDLEFLLNNIES